MMPLSANAFGEKFSRWLCALDSPSRESGGRHFPNYRATPAAGLRHAALLGRAAAAPCCAGCYAWCERRLVGILGAALYSPVWTSAVFSPPDFALALAGFLLLTVWRAPPWIVVLLLAAARTLLQLI